MPGLVAPAKRVGFFMSDMTGASFNSSGSGSGSGSGWILFDAAVNWATGPLKKKSD
jgi:hypothetical protein